MKTISSRDNPLFKRLKALAGSTQQQRRDAQALLEGPHLLGAYLDAIGQPAQCFVTSDALRNDEIAALIARIDAARVVVLDAALFAQASSVVNGVGLLALADAPSPALPERIDGGCVVLDGVQDAGNVGSILRSAAAAGVTDVFCTPGTAFAWSAKVLRAGMGAHFLLRIVEQAAPDALLARLAVPVALTDVHGARPLYDADLARPLAWVFGNEGAGVSAVWRAAPHEAVTIPQPGGMESLNVAAAAAVCLFEQCRQRAGSMCGGDGRT